MTRTNGRADYPTRSHAEEEESGTPATRTTPASPPRPRPTALTVTVRRVIQVRPYETAEVTASLTCDPDPAHTAGANVDRVYTVLRDRVLRHAEELRAQS